MRGENLTYITSFSVHGSPMGKASQFPYFIGWDWGLHCAPSERDSPQWRVPKQWWPHAKFTHLTEMPWFKCLSVLHVVSHRQVCSSQFCPPSVVNQFLGHGQVQKPSGEEMVMWKLISPLPSSITTTFISSNLFPLLWLHRGRSAGPLVLGWWR